MKNHEEIRKMLAAMAGDDLTESERERVERHVDRCPECRRELAQLREVVKAIRESPDVEPPPWLTARIMARVKEEAAPRRSWREILFRPWRVKLPIEGLALLMICVMAWYVIQDLDRGPQPPLVAPGVQAPKPAVEKSLPPAIPQKKAPPSVSLGDHASPFPGPVPSITPSHAPPPAAVPADPMAADKAAEVMPAAPSRGEQAAGGPSVLAERKTAAATRKADGAPSLAASPPLRLRLEVKEPENMNERIFAVTRRLGGTVVDDRAGRLTVRIQAGRLPELIAECSRLGLVVERPQGPLPGAGVVELQVGW